LIAKLFGDFIDFKAKSAIIAIATLNIGFECNLLIGLHAVSFQIMPRFEKRFERYSSAVLLSLMSPGSSAPALSNRSYETCF